MLKYKLCQISYVNVKGTKDYFYFQIFTFKAEDSFVVASASITVRVNTVPGISGIKAVDSQGNIITSGYALFTAFTFYVDGLLTENLEKMRVLCRSMGRESAIPVRSLLQN